MTAIDFTHKINYRSVLGSPKRPYSPVRLFAPNGSSMKVIGILDSGADACMFKPDVADALGIQWMSGQQLDITGIEGGGVIAYQHDLFLQIEPMTAPINCRVIFSESAPENLIGREGIFHMLYICFHEKVGRVYMSMA